MLIDTHCHLHDQEWFTPDQAKDALQDAHARDVKQVICIGTDPDDSLIARDFASTHQNIFWTYGIHPEFADKYTDTATVSPDSRLVAVGEIGLDYHYEPFSRSSQIRLFEQMLQLAKDLNLPVSLHVREAFSDLWPVLNNFPDLTGVVHSFTGGKRDLAEALRRGFYIGVNGLATYTTTPLPPLEKMLLETDAPFLTPYHNRGTMNVPGNVSEIAAFLSGKLGVAEEIIAEQTTHNATQLFGIKLTGDGFFAPSDPA